MSIEEKLPDYVLSALDEETVERLGAFSVDSRTMRMLEAESKYYNISVEELVRRIIKKHIERF